MASRDGGRRRARARQHGVRRWAGGRVPSRGAPDEDEGWLQTLMAPVVAAINAGTQASTSILGTVLGLARHPLRAAGLLLDGAGVAGELGYLLVMSSDSATRFKGKPNGSKRVAWSEPLKLPEVKAASRALGCTINDMLLSCVAGAMRDYLEEKGDRTEGVEVRALAPIDLRQPGDVSLGNRFGILAVLLPVGIEHPLERLMTVRQRMLALKTSYEPATTLGLFAALGYLPKAVQDQLFNLLLRRTTAVMTNVPGPSEPLTLAGSTLKQCFFWVPQTGDIGMGVSIYSYAGMVQFGLITDAALTPDPEAVVSRFPEEFEGIVTAPGLRRSRWPASRTRMNKISYRGYRFAPEIIQQAIWLYLRFTLSLRDVEDLLAERGVAVSYETVRRWVNHFGPMIAADLRKRRLKPHTTWHLDEVYLKIDGRMVYLWRAVDAEGEVLDVLVQSKRNKHAALKLMRKLLKKYAFVPERLVTDDLRSYSAAVREIGIERQHERGRWKNNR